MKSFTVVKGIAAPKDRANVDTDMIIPKQFLKSIKRSGFGPYLFDEVRHHDEGYHGKDPETRDVNMDYPLNHERYQGASILLARENFGCGSSREHAPWALEDYGFRAIIAPSFADIFYNNCFKNGILPIILSHEIVDQLFFEMYELYGYQLEIDLPAQEVRTPVGESFSFEVDAFRKHCLLNGLDDIGITLEDTGVIEVFEKNWQQQCPWLFGAIKL